MKGVGIHCFAGGFTMGVKTVLPVVGQLEIHNFGRQTCDAHGTKFMNAERWEDWHEYRPIWDGCSFCYGNPRCTAFSSYSSGSDRSVRGPTAAPTRDIWDLCEFGVEQKLDLIAFESVQQAYSVGKVLLNRLRDDLFVPNYYRICHLFVNTAAEGNAQKRRRYFLIAYRNDRNFNITLPKLPEYRVTVGDVLITPYFQNRTPVEGKLTGKKWQDYTADTYTKLTPDEKKLVPYLQQGANFNSFAHEHYEQLEKISPTMYKKWLNRNSDIPFSLHCPTKLKLDRHCPTIASTSARLIHPIQSRPCTVAEVATLMGWPQDFIPVGPDPIGQIGKGVVPATGAWLAEQIKMFLNNDWGEDDYESVWDGHQLVGHNYTGKAFKPIEKTFNLTKYIPPFKELV